MDLTHMTPGQRASIKHLDGPLLICAGAGSGKTFTLTQRIAWALLPGSGADGKPFLNSIDEALVITFTNKAAGEIKDRVRSTLRAEGMMQEALKVDGAWISTIHGMCNRILHEHALELGLDPAFELVMDADCDVARVDATNQVLRAAEEDGQNPYRHLFAAFEPKAIFDMVDNVLAMASYQTAGLDAVDLGPSGESVAAYLADLLDKCDALSVIGTEKNRTEAELLAGKLHELMNASCTVEDLASALDGVNGNNLRGKKADELRLSVNTVKQELALAGNRACAEELLELARAVDSVYRGILHAQAAMDTSNLIRTTLRAFDEHPEIAALYTQKFKLIMVDEFQDTSQLQIDMIGRIAGAEKRHLCTVGDAQQSIYRFQGADVEVYLRHKREMTSPAVGALQEQLVDNFRSHGDVLALVRRICGQPGYFSEPFLDLQAATNGKVYHGAGPRIELALTTYRDAGSEWAARAEAAHIAERFSELRAAGHSAHDMVILMGSTTNAEIYAQAMRDAGFACVVAGGSKFFDSDHVALCQCLLNVLVNPYDSESLLVVLSSEMLPVSSDDLLFLSTYLNPETGGYLRQNPALGLLDYDRALFHASPLLQHARDVLQRAWACLGDKRPYDLFMQVIVESGWLGRLQEQGAEGQAKAADVLKFARLVKEASAGNANDMGRVAQELQHRSESSKEKPGALTVSSADAVRIMTVHASKGLEFPIVAVTNCYTASTDRTRPLMMADNGRIYTSLPPAGFKDSLTTYPLDEELQAADAQDPYDFMRAIRETNNAREYAEKKRLFYVAATRASDAVIVCMKHKLGKDGAPQAYKDVETDILESLFPGQSDFPAEEGPFDYGGSEPGLFTRRFADDSEAVLDAAGARDAQGDDEEGASGKRSDEGTITFPVLGEQTAVHTEPVDMREGFFSYTSIAPHDTDAAAAGAEEPGGESSVSQGTSAENVLERAQDEDAPAQHPDDSDKATVFGSAVHQTCEWMALHKEMPADEEVRAAALRFARQWGVADTDRLLRAVERWKDSETCRTAFAFPQHQPEVPFVVPVGDKVLEGEIDLLCYDPSERNEHTDRLPHACIVDYKTGGSARETQEGIQAKHLLQAECYAYATLLSGFNSVELHFVRVEQEDAQGHAQTANYAFSADDLDTLKSAIVAALGASHLTGGRSA